jgi:hypothetical protein
MSDHQFQQTVQLGEDGIYRIRSTPGAHLAIEDAQQIIAYMAATYGPLRHPALVDISGLRSISREAREYFAGPETARVESAVALIVKSPLSRAVGNFFLGINRALMPTKLFATDDPAIAWLEGFIV